MGTFFPKKLPLPRAESDEGFFPPLATLLAKDVKIRDLSGGSKETYQEAGWIWSAHPVSHHAVSVFKDPLARSVHYE